MKTECNLNSFPFQTETSRQVIAQFDGGTITSDGGGLLLREVERLTGILRQFSDCFVDHRDPDLIEHTVEDLVSQRIYALALGYVKRVYLAVFSLYRPNRPFSHTL